MVIVILLLLCLTALAVVVEFVPASVPPFLLSPFFLSSQAILVEVVVFLCSMLFFFSLGCLGVSCSV